MIGTRGTFMVTFDDGESITLVVKNDMATIDFFARSATGVSTNQHVHLRAMKSEMRDALRALLKVLEDDE